MLNAALSRTFLRPLPRNSRIITISVPVPVRQVRRTVNYTYPSPYQSPSRVGRIQLNPHVRHPLRVVRIRVPKFSPAVPGAYVSLSRGRLNIHSRKQLQRLLAHGEFNRRRYNEHKTRSRHYRDGQLQSLRSDPYGIVASAYNRGLSARRIADAALYSRALTGR
jgi:hypothetical protein